MISLPCFLLRYKFGWAFGIRPRKSCANIKVHFDDSTCIKTIFGTRDLFNISYSRELYLFSKFLHFEEIVRVKMAVCFEMIMSET